MRSSRVLNTIIASSLAGTAIYGLFSANQAQKHSVVAMKPTKNHDSQSSRLLDYDFLKGKIADDNNHSAIFACALRRQHQTLTSEQVIELATLAVQKHHVISLDLLAGYFPQIITPAWLNHALVVHPDRFLYSSLLRKHAAGKIHHLNYLFEPQNDVVLIEKSDHASIATAGLFTHQRKIVLIDTEPYDPSYKYLT